MNSPKKLGQSSTASRTVVKEVVSGYKSELVRIARNSEVNKLGKKRPSFNALSPRILIIGRELCLLQFFVR